jgi:thymidine phosphorylase
LIVKGTVDKLESIPGFVCGIRAEEFENAVKKHGIAIACQGADIAPADGVLYGTRNITATVPSIPLITSSILSKKLSEGLKALVMDVKFGRAAFMTEFENARKLAQSIVS